MAKLHSTELSALPSLSCCRKPYRKGLTPYYFAAVQPGLSGNEQFFYFTSLVCGALTAVVMAAALCWTQDSQQFWHVPSPVLLLGLSKQTTMQGYTSRPGLWVVANGSLYGTASSTFCCWQWQPLCKTYVALHSLYWLSRQSLAFYRMCTQH